MGRLGAEAPGGFGRMIGAISAIWGAAAIPIPLPHPRRGLGDRPGACGGPNPFIWGLG